MSAQLEAEAKLRHQEGEAKMAYQACQTLRLKTGGGDDDDAVL
jgi:hypothetical protein